MWTFHGERYSIYSLKIFQIYNQLFLQGFVFIPKDGWLRHVAAAGEGIYVWEDEGVLYVT